MTKPCLIFIYASQQGNAQSIAQDFRDECSKVLGIPSEVTCISDIGHKLELFFNYKFIVFILSTTGDGEPPDSARKFWRFLHKYSKNPTTATSRLASLKWSELQYTVLGLGDTNYTNFCNFGKNIDELFQLLGATRFFPCGWADDGTGLDIVIEPWREALWPTLGRLFNNSSQPVTLSDVRDRETRIEVCSQDLNFFEIKTLPVLESKSSIVTDPAMIEFDDSESLTFVHDSNESGVNAEKILPDSVYRKQWCLTHILQKLELPYNFQLTVPKILNYTSLSIDYELAGDTDFSVAQQNIVSLPFFSEPLTEVRISSFKLLSCNSVDKPVKKTVELVAELPSNTLCYEPGDSIGVLVHNNEDEVSFLIDRLSISQPDTVCHLTKSASAKRQFPSHLPKQATPRQLLTSYLDYRCLPKKSLLLLMLQCTEDAHEKRCLEELVSKEGSDIYQRKVIDNRLTFLDLLVVFNKCKIELSALIDVLPRLLPRYYSLTSTPLKDPTKISFTYSLTEIPQSETIFKDRLGVCTGHFDSILASSEKSSDDSVYVPSSSAYLQIYLRNTKTFRFPSDPSLPVIMVGPGCGIAPFIGFLRHRKQFISDGKLNISELGESWLYSGCRYRDGDQLYKAELEEFLKFGILSHLRSCSSRDAEPIIAQNEQISLRYVQDGIRADEKVLSTAIVEANAHIFVCGDASNMAKDVQAAFADVIASKLQITVIESFEYIKNLQLSHRYKQDVWT